MEPVDDPYEEALLTAIGIYIATMAIAIHISYNIILTWGMTPTVATVISTIMITAAMIARKSARTFTRDIFIHYRRLQQR